MDAEKEKTLLLVDDEAIIAATEKMTLEKFGYRVFIAHSGEEAAALVEKTPAIDLILMDINLGAGMDGTEAAALILRRRDIPVVFLSSHMEPEVVAKTEKITSYGYVVKDSSGTVLDASIKMAFKLFEAKVKEKEKEAALSDSEEWNKLILGTVLSGVMVVDAETHKIVDVNDTGLKLIGLAKEQVLGSICHRFVCPSEENSCPVLDLGKKVDLSEKILLTGDGKQKSIIKTVVLIARHGRKYLIESFVDISERKRAEEELKKRNKYIESILNNMPIGFAANTIDDGVARYMNDNFTKIYGWPKEVLTDVDQFFEKVSPGAEGKELKARIMRDMGSGNPARMVWDNVEITTGAGERRYISARNIPIPEQNLMVSMVWDTTRMHESQKALRESEERYRSILNASPDCIAITDMEGRIVMVSPAALTMFGYPQEEMLGHLFIEFVFPDDRERASSNVANMFQGSVTGLGEYQGLRADGSSIELEVNGGFVRGAEGRPTHMVFVIRDISNRKRAEEKQHEAEIRYRLLFEQSPDGIIIIDPATACIMEFNETAHQQLGYSREEFSQLSIADIDAVETPEEVLSHIARVMHEGLSEFETRQRTKQGEIREIHVTAQFTKMLDRPLYHCIWRDITERKRTEEAIKNTIHFQQVLMDAVPSPIFYKDAKLIYIGGNKAFEQYIGLSPEQFIGKTVYDISPADLAERYDQADSELLKNPGVQTYEASIVHADGTRRNVVFNKATFTNVEGSVAGLIGVILDITERKRAEEEIKKQLAEKEILLKEVHHRIKNNIASIGGLLSLRLQSVSNAEAVTVLQETIGRIDSMRILYDKLLLGEDYKNISAKNYLDDLIEKIIAIFPDKAKIKLKKRIDDFQLDPKRLFPLGIIINELLTNKMKYAFSNRDSGLIKIALEKADRHITLAIEDDGNELPDKFDINESKGFGLMLVKMLSQQLGGSFSMKKKAGTRCTVEFNI